MTRLEPLNCRWLKPSGEKARERAFVILGPFAYPASMPGLIPAARGSPVNGARAEPVESEFQRVRELLRQI